MIQDNHLNIDVLSSTNEFYKVGQGYHNPLKDLHRAGSVFNGKTKADMLHLHKGLEIRQIQCAHIISENHFSVGGGEGAKDKTITHFAW